MDTTSLFNFEFVDRYKERKIFSNYTATNSSEQILWITGERGIGKTRFVKQMMLELSDRKIIWVDNSIQNASENALFELLNKLQEISGDTFFNFIKNNCQMFFDTGKDIISTLLSDKNVFLTHILDLFFNATSKAIDKNNTSKGVYQSFISYMDEISSVYPLFIVFDNFSRYDKVSAHIFLDLIRKYINSNKIKFCIITTDDDIKLNEELETKICMNIPFQSITLKEFPSYIFFGEILYRIFGKSLFNYDDVKYIYEKCKGNPENLIKIIKKGLKRNTIVLTNDSIMVNKESLYTILRTETTHFSLDDFTFKEQLLLLDIICIGKVVNTSFLKLTVDFLAKKIFMYSQFKEDSFFETLGQLINDSILLYGPNDTLIFEHDSTFLDICDILYDLKLKPQICFYLYELFLETDLSTYGYSAENYEYYKAYYAAEAYIPGWEKINFEYAYSLVKRYLYHDASAIFDKIPLSYFNNTPQNWFIIAYTYYEDGQYQKCFNILNMFSLDNSVDESFLYKYYFILGKSENILGKKNDAITHFKQALMFVAENSPEYVETLNLLHLTYMEIPNGREYAKRIFIHIKDEFKTTTPMEWAKTMRGAANFYDGEEALSLLKAALEIAIREKNIIESAYIKNSIGFINLRTGNIHDAENNFSEAYNILQNHKAHETSYALNNRAICYMLNRNYENALTDLLNALLWNSTPYAYYTINCHLAICYFFMNQKKETERIVTILEKYLLTSKIEDSVVARKVAMNLGIAHYHMNNTIISNNFFRSMQLDDVTGTSSEYRYRIYTQQMNSYECKYNNCYYKNKDFEPWVLIYGHD